MNEEVGRRQNVIIIIIDALRRSDLGCYGSNIVKSPNIDDLAKRSIKFVNGFSTANCTDPAITSILSGRYPINHGITTHGKEVTKQHQMALKRSGTSFIQEALRGAGYRTIGIDFLERWHKRGYDEYLTVEEKKNILDRVMDAAPSMIRSKYHEIKQRLGFNYGMNIKRDKGYSDIAIERIRDLSRRNEPFFMFIHYWGVHIPYEPLEDHVARSDIVKEVPDLDIISEATGPWKKSLKKLMGNERDLRKIIARYYSCIHEVDIEIGRMIDTLEETGAMDNTVILLTSDHGESLYEHGVMFDHHGLYDVSIRVPLILHLPGVGERVIEEQVQHIDVFPTIMEHIGVGHGTADGMSLIGLIKGDGKGREMIYTEENYTQRKRSIRTGRFKYIFAESEEDATCRYCDKVHGGIEELYDLRSDPDEMENILDEKREVADLMKSALENERRRLRRVKKDIHIGTAVNKIRDRRIKPKI